MDNDLYLEYREITSVTEGIEIGEATPSREYHILLRKKKKVLVTHFFWQKCEFCRLEDENGIVNLK
jgi:hypothetical protein